MSGEVHYPFGHIDPKALKPVWIVFQTDTTSTRQIVSIHHTEERACHAIDESEVGLVGGVSLATDTEAAGYGADTKRMVENSCWADLGEHDREPVAIWIERHEVE